MPDSDVELRIAALKEQFRHSLDERIYRLEQAVRECLDDCITDRLNNVRFLAHSLAGAAGIYGFENISNACRALEQHIDHITTDNSDFTCDSQKLMTLMTDIKAALSAAN